MSTFGGRRVDAGGQLVVRLAGWDVDLSIAGRDVADFPLRRLLREVEADARQVRRGPAIGRVVHLESQDRAGGQLFRHAGGELLRRSPPGTQSARIIQAVRTSFILDPSFAMKTPT